MAQGGRETTARHLLPVRWGEAEGGVQELAPRRPDFLPRSPPCRNLRRRRKVPARTKQRFQDQDRQARRHAEEAVRRGSTPRGTRLQEVVTVHPGTRRENRPDERAAGQDKPTAARY